MQRLLLLLILLSILSATALWAAEWPQSVKIAGFEITRIKGTLGADGVGKATGTLKLPRGGETPVSLVKDAKGGIKASISQAFNIGKLSIDGDCNLDQSGLKGSGTVKMDGQSVTSANFRVDPQGNLDGNGRVDFGSISVPVAVNVNGSQITIRGSTPHQSSIETPVARYMFKGELQLTSAKGPLAVNAVGTIERRGKVGKSADTFGPITSLVNTRNGQAGFNVAGVNLNFRMW